MRTTGLVCAVVALGFAAELIKDSRLDGKSPFIIGTVPLDKVFVSVGLMKLYHLHTRAVLHTHHQVREPPGDESLTYPWRALKYQVFLAAEPGEHVIKFLLTEEEFG